MREIKFRGKTIDGKWIFGYLIKQGAYYFIQNEHGGNDAVIESTIGQFTGLQDKNGKDVYEGDLLDFDEEEWGGKFNSEVIKFEDIIGTWDLAGSKSDVSKWRKIVGNIYE